MRLVAEGVQQGIVESDKRPEITLRKKGKVQGRWESMQAGIGKARSAGSLGRPGLERGYTRAEW